MATAATAQHPGEAHRAAAPPRAGGAAAAVIAAAPRSPYRRPDQLQVGGPAPDFELEQLGGLGEAAGEARRVRLSSFQRDRPVVLFFGSYT